MVVFFFNDTATTEIYTLSLHDALPILGDTSSGSGDALRVNVMVKPIRSGLKTNLVVTTSRRTYLLELTSTEKTWMADRKSTRLNSSHLVISYAVFCLKKQMHIYYHVSP